MGKRRAHLTGLVLTAVSAVSVALVVAGTLFAVDRAVETIGR